MIIDLKDSIKTKFKRKLLDFTRLNHCQKNYTKEVALFQNIYKLILNFYINNFFYQDFIVNLIIFKMYI